MIPDEVVDKIEIALTDLAYYWRGASSDNDVENAKKLVNQYRELLLWLLKWGWTGHLDPDSELPDRLLPEEYIKYRGF